MKYWWVNHKQTNKEELDGGYIWSPKENKNGARNQSYINLTRAQPGDKVISFADGLIKAIGVVTHPYSEAPKPSEFGIKGTQWNDTGWLVKIDWIRIKEKLRPKKHIENLRPFLPEKHSPIQASGNGNQGCYLAEIGEHLYQAILELTGSDRKLFDELIEQDTLTVADEAAEQAIINRIDIPVTEIQQLVNARRGQGLYKANLMNIEKLCRLTGVADSRFLIASHIKPWRVSSDQEKLDGNNGLLLAPHVDKLFDQGWISFDDQGNLLLSSTSIETVLNQWRLPTSINVGSFNPEQQTYLQHHREYVFKC